MEDISKIIEILNYRKRSDLGLLLQGATYDLDITGTYGSRAFSSLTSAHIYSPIGMHEKLINISEEDQQEIIKAFHVIYPVRDNDIEISWLEFFVDPNASIPSSGRELSRLSEIDFSYISEQIVKCDQKIHIADYEGSITNARNLIETICKYILDDCGEKYKETAELPALYKKVISVLNMNPKHYEEKIFKEILSGCFSIIHGLASIRNVLSDAHGKSQKSYYKPTERHATFCTGVAKTLAEYLYSSYTDNIKKKNIQPKG